MFSHHDWLLSTIFSMLHQMMYQDLQLYVLIVTLRSNNATNLIVISYYMKFDEKNKTMSSWHIDLNVNDFIKRRDENRVQSLTMFENEFDELRTKYYMSMHRSLKKWWKEMKTRELTIDEYTCVLTEDMLKKEDLKKFRIEKEIVNCSIESVTFRMSHILYENVEITQKKKIIVSVCLTAMFEDENILKVSECETRREITTTFTDLKVSTMIFSDLRSNTFAISFRHSIAVKIRNCSITEDVMLRLRSWNSAAVQKKRDILFEENDDRYKRLMRTVKEAALRRIRADYLNLKKAKKRVYESEFFWFDRKDFFNLYIKLFQHWCDWLKLELKEFFLY